AGQTATFVNAFPGVSMIFSAENDQFKESLSLQSALAASTFSYSIRTSPDLQLRANSMGGIDLVRMAGTALMSFSPPFMYDSTNTPTGLSRAVSMTLSS